MTPQAYIAAKATVIREYRKRGDELSRKVARDLLKCDINKVGKIWDFLVRVGVIQPPPEPPASAVTAPEISVMDTLPNGDING
jgi:transcriptional adapter 2-alpha